jgi:hypothetical protein
VFQREGKVFRMFASFACACIRLARRGVVESLPDLCRVMVTMMCGRPCRRRNLWINQSRGLAALVGDRLLTIIDAGTNQLHRNYSYPRPRPCTDGPIM